jgi:hypothetical protein
LLGKTRKLARNDLNAPIDAFAVIIGSRARPLDPIVNTVKQAKISGEFLRLHCGEAKKLHNLLAAFIVQSKLVKKNTIRLCN